MSIPGKWRLLPAMALLLFAAAILAADPVGVSPAIPRPEWDQVFEQQPTWAGGDVAASLLLPGDRILWLFGDSWVGGDCRTRSQLVNNSLALHRFDPQNPGAPPRPEDLRFHWGPPDSAGRPTAFFRPEAGEAWFWPTGGGAVVTTARGLRLVVFLIRLQKTPGSTVWCFDCTGSVLALIDNPADPPEQWGQRLLSLPHQSGAGLETDWGAAALFDGGRAGRSFLFIFGTRSDAEQRRDLVLARVRPDQVESFANWEFWRDGKWTSNPEGAAPLVRGVASELSVDRVTPKDGRPPYFLLVSSEGLLGSRIFVRTAPAPTGPWSDAAEIFSAPIGGASQFTYAAKGHADLSEPGSILVSYIINTHDLAELRTNEFIYRPRFISAPLPR